VRSVLATILGNPRLEDGDVSRRATDRRPGRRTAEQVEPFRRASDSTNLGRESRGRLVSQLPERGGAFPESTESLLALLENRTRILRLLQFQRQAELELFPFLVALLHLPALIVVL
jgi:hypothetical protein